MSNDERTAAHLKEEGMLPSDVDDISVRFRLGPDEAEEVRNRRANGEDEATVAHEVIARRTVQRRVYQKGPAGTSYPEEG